MTSGNITVNNQVNGADIEIYTGNGKIQTAAAGTLTATATDGTITIGTTKGDIVLSGAVSADQKVEVEASGGSATLNGAVKSANNEVEVTAQGAVTTGATLTAKTNVNVTSQGGNAALGGIVTAETGFVSVNASTGISATKALNAKTDVTLASTNSNITTEAKVTAASGDVSIGTGTGNIGVQEVEAGQDISLTTTNGNITSSGVLTAKETVSLNAVTSGNINVNNQVNGADIEFHTVNGNIETVEAGSYINAGSHLVLTAENGNIGRKNSVISKLIPLLILNNPNLEIDVTAQNAWLEGIAPSTEDMGTMILQKVNVSNEFGAESEGALTVKKVTGTNGETVEGFTAKDIYLNAAGNLFVDGDVKAYGIADLTSQRGIITLNRTVIGGQVYISTEKTEREEGEQAGNVIINNNVTATAPGGGILIITDVGNIQTAETGTLTATNGTITASATHGDIVLRGAVTSDQKVEVDASAGSVTLDGTVESEDGEVEITAQGAVTANAAIQAGADVMLLSKNADVLVRNTVTSLAGSVNATAETGLAVIGSVHAENNIKLATDAGGITVSAQVTSDTGNISMATGGGLIEIGDTVHAIQGNVTAHVDTVRTSTDTASPIVNAIGVGGDIIAGRTVSLTAEEGSIGIGVGATTAQGKVDAGGNIIISSGKGEIDVYNSVTSTGGDISISNVEEAIYVQGAVIASAGDVKTTSVTGDILVSKDISVGENKNVLLETTKGNIYVGTFTDEEHGTVSTSGSIGATEGNTAGNVTIKTGEGVIDILKSIASTNIKVENGKGDIFIGINQPSEETVTATNNIYLSTELGQIKVYGKTSTDHGDITMKAAANNFNEENPGSNFIIGYYFGRSEW